MRKINRMLLAFVAALVGCQSPRLLVAERQNSGIFHGSDVTIYLENTPGKGDYGLIGVTTINGGIHYEVPEHLRSATVGMIVAYDDVSGTRVCQVSSVNTSADVRFEVPLPGVEEAAWAKVFGTSSPGLAGKTIAPAPRPR